MIYLDYAAATPVDKAVLAAAEPYFTRQFYNPSALYQPARNVKVALHDARATISDWLGCRAEEITFTAGGTEANNIAIKGVMNQFPDKKCVISAVEHESVRSSARSYQVSTVGVHEDGTVDPDTLRQSIDDETVLVSVIYANNEIGTVQPLKRLAAVVAAIRQQRKRDGNNLPLYLHTDACQAPSYLDLHVHNLGVDMMTLNGGKIYGFKQSGCLFVDRRVQLLPLIAGGGQERGLRNGTENVAQSVGLAVALDRVQQQRDAEVNRLKQLQTAFIKNLTEKFDKAVINGSQKYRLPNNVHVTFPGQHNEMLLLRLEQEGVLAAAGSACSANDREKPSYVLEAIGRTDADAQASIRFSFGEQTSEAEVRQVISALEKSLSVKQ